MIKFLLGGFSVLLQFADFIFYFRGIFNKTTKPHFFTWLIWSISMWTVFLVQYSSEAGAGAWATVTSAMLSTIVALLAFSQKQFQYSKLDWFCLVIVLIALWFWTSQEAALIAVLLITFIDGVGYLPMIKKTLKDPFSEPLTAFIFASVKYIPSLFAMQQLSVVNVLYPASLVVFNTSFVVLLFLLQRRHK